MIKTKWRMEPLCSGNPGFFKALGCCHGNSIFFVHNNVFMTLVPAGGLLANKGGQNSLRQRQNTRSAIYFQEQKTRFLALSVFFFFFPLCFATKMQIAYVAHKAPITWPTKNNFLYLIVALLSNFDRLELKG